MYFICDFPSLLSALLYHLPSEFKLNFYFMIAASSRVRDDPAVGRGLDRGLAVDGRAEGLLRRDRGQRQPQGQGLLRAAELGLGLRGGLLRQLPAGRER